MEPQLYFHSDTYHSIIDRLENVVRDFDANAPIDLRSMLIEALGEAGNIWPMSIFSGDDDAPAIAVCS